MFSFRFNLKNKKYDKMKKYHLVTYDDNNYMGLFDTILSWI